MEENVRKNTNLKGERLQEIIDSMNFIPNSNYLLVTINEYESENGLELVSETELTLDEWQYVVAASPTARYKAGDKVYLNLKRLVKKVVDPNDRMRTLEQIDITPFEFEGHIFAVMDDNSILGKLDMDVINMKA